MTETSAFKARSQGDLWDFGFTGFQPSKKTITTKETTTTKSKFQIQGENLPGKNRWRIKHNIQ